MCKPLLTRLMGNRRTINERGRRRKGCILYRYVRCVIWRMQYKKPMFFRRSSAFRLTACHGISEQQLLLMDCAGECLPTHGASRFPIVASERKNRRRSPRATKYFQDAFLIFNNYIDKAIHSWPGRKLYIRVSTVPKACLLYRVYVHTLCIQGYIKRWGLLNLRGFLFFIPSSFL